MDLDLVKWTNFFMERPIGGELGVEKGFLLGKFQMDHGLVNWIDFFIESPIGGERGVTGVFTLENIQMDPNSGM